MNIIFEKMNKSHQEPIMAIFNEYIRTSTAAFPAQELPEQFYEMMGKKANEYPAYAVLDAEINEVIGFCMLGAYSPLSSFKGVATLSYFIRADYTGKGIGSIILTKLEKEAMQCGIKELIAEISSENEGSMRFHEKHGFIKVGELKNIGQKFGRSFGVVYMQKTLGQDVFDSIYSHVEYRAEDNVVFLAWKQFCCLDDYRTPTLFAAGLLKRYASSNFVVDARNGFEDDKRDVEWGFSVLLPLMSKSDCKHCIFILNEVNEIEEEMDLWTKEFMKYFKVSKVKSYEEAISVLKA